MFYGWCEKLESFHKYVFGLCNSSSSPCSFRCRVLCLCIAHLAIFFLLVPCNFGMCTANPRKHVFRKKEKNVFKSDLQFVLRMYEINIITSVFTNKYNEYLFQDCKLFSLLFHYLYSKQNLFRRNRRTGKRDNHADSILTSTFPQRLLTIVFFWHHNILVCTFNWGKCCHRSVVLPLLSKTNSTALPSHTFNNNKTVS